MKSIERISILIRFMTGGNLQNGSALQRFYMFFTILLPDLDTLPAGKV